ncbi:13799_t:CDS:2, partial [Racocetra fulgida]
KNSISRKKLKTDISTNITVPVISTSKYIINSQSNEYDNINTLSYYMDEFQNAELSEESAKFVFEIELDSELLDIVELG